MPWATDSRQKLITENPRSFCSSGFVLRGLRGAPVYLKFSAAFYKRRWGRGARLRLEASACGPLYRKASISEARSASASGRSPGGAGETLAGGFPRQAAPGGSGLCPALR